ncbi:MAG: NfeD family protein [Pseudomonadota bacterium]
MISTQTAFMAFAGAFTVTAAILFAGWIASLGQRLRPGPKRPHIILGKDMRGRTAIISDIAGTTDQVFGVSLHGERWQARLAPRRLVARESAVRVGDRVVIKKIEGLTVFVEPKK